MLYVYQGWSYNLTYSFLWDYIVLKGILTLFPDQNIKKMEVLIIKHEFNVLAYEYAEIIIK